MPALRRERDVVSADLPGFGDSPPVAGPTSVTTLADATTEFLGQHHLFGIDMAGVGLGGMVGLELVARGVVARAVVFSPELGALRHVARVAWLAQRAPGMARALTSRRGAASVLFRGYSTKLADVPQEVLRETVEDYARARRLWETVRALRREGVVDEGVIERRVVVGWGRQDRICPPARLAEVRRRFTGAEVVWIDRCGHLPQWDQPEEMVRIILSGTADNA